MPALMRAIKRKVWLVEDRMNLRQQVTIATALLSLLMVATLAVGAASVGRSEAITSAQTTLNEIAMTFTDRIDRSISSRLSTVEHLASLGPLKDTWLGPPEVARSVLALTKSSFVGTEWVGFATPDGVVRAAAGGAFEGHSVAHYDWFQKGLQHATVVEGADSRSGRSASAPDGALSRFVDIGVPVHASSGELIGVLGLYLGRDWVARLRASTVGGMGGDRGIGIDLLTASGENVFDDAADWLPKAVQQGMLEKGHGVTSGADFAGQIAAFATTSAVGNAPRWMIVARQSATQAFQTANRVVLVIVGLGVLLALAGVLGAMLIAARVSRPFQTLAEEVAQIGRNSVTMPPRVRGSFEATRLSTALRALVLRLTVAEKSNAEASNRVADVERKMNEDIALLKNIADTDMLTQLLNRRAFLDVAKESVDEYRRGRGSVAVLMIDIDEFKRINDRLGHAAGDGVIRSVAASIRGALRPTDSAARFGGEEFVILLRNVTAEVAIEAAERIRFRVVQSPAMTVNGEVPVTISVGVAVISGADRSIDELIERADVALYAAKGAGRNRISVAHAALEERRRA